MLMKDRRTGFRAAILSASVVALAVLVLLGVDTNQSMRAPTVPNAVFSRVEHRIDLVRAKMSEQVRVSESTESASLQSANRYRKRLSRVSRKLLHEGLRPRAASND